MNATSQSLNAGVIRSNCTQCPPPDATASTRFDSIDSSCWRGVHHMRLPPLATCADDDDVRSRDAESQRAKGHRRVRPAMVGSKNPNQKSGRRDDWEERAEMG